MEKTPPAGGHGPRSQASRPRVPGSHGAGLLSSGGSRTGVSRSGWRFTDGGLDIVTGSPTGPSDRTRSGLDSSPPPTPLWSGSLVLLLRPSLVSAPPRSLLRSPHTAPSEANQSLAFPAGPGFLKTNLISEQVWVCRAAVETLSAPRPVPAPPSTLHEAPCHGRDHTDARHPR